MMAAHLHVHSLSAFAGPMVARGHGVRTLEGRPGTLRSGASTPVRAMLPNGRRITH